MSNNWSRTAIPYNPEPAVPAQQELGEDYQARKAEAKQHPHERPTDLAEPKRGSSEPPRHRRPSQGVRDIVRDGQGFIIEKYPLQRLPGLCRYCHAPILNPAGTWICLFDGEVTERPIVSPGQVCRCSWCEWNEDAPKTGPLSVTCGGSECKKRLKREQKRTERDREKDSERIQAIEIIRVAPNRHDKDIAKELGIRPIRVREARRLSLN